MMEQNQQKNEETLNILTGWEKPILTQWDSAQTFSGPGPGPDGFGQQGS